MHVARTHRPMIAGDIDTDEQYSARRRGASVEAAARYSGLSICKTDQLQGGVFSVAGFCTLRCVFWACVSTSGAELHYSPGLQQGSEHLQNGSVAGWCVLSCRILYAEVCILGVCVHKWC